MAANARSLDQAESKTLKPPSKFHSVVDNGTAKGLDEQNLDGFELQDMKFSAADRHERLNELANSLSGLYRETLAVSK